MRLLLAIDDSKFSEAARQAVIAQFQPQGTEVKVLNVANPIMPILEQDTLKHGWELVQRAEHVLKMAGYAVQTSVEEGDPRSRIIDEANQWNADLIVLGSHGRRGVERFLMGSVAESVVRHARCAPCALHCRDNPHTQELKSTRGRTIDLGQRVGCSATNRRESVMRILLAIDGSKLSEAATQAVIETAKPHETEVQIIYVIDMLTNQLPEMTAYYPGIEHERDAQRKPAEALVAKTAELLRSKGLSVTTAVELGNPKSKIIDTALKWHADLIVLGSHGRTGLERFLMGSVADAVARHAPCSVKVVRIPRAEESCGTAP